MKTKLPHNIINIIGMGELGKEIYDEISKKESEVYGIEIDTKRLKELKNKKYRVYKSINSIANTYIVSVYTTKQLWNVLEEIEEYKHPETRPLISIEGTIEPCTHKLLKNFSKKVPSDIVLFPHRYNPNDKKHHIFNLDRLLSGLTKKAENRALEFYSKFMDKKLIHVYPIEVVELAKSLENAYRYIEITMAQHIYDLCEKKDLDFKILREAINTKWNIDIKEARKGVGGKCLPKDMDLVCQYFDSELFDLLKQYNEDYKERNK